MRNLTKILFKTDKIFLGFSIKKSQKHKIKENNQFSVVHFMLKTAKIPINGYCTRTSRFRTLRGKWNRKTIVFKF